MSDLEQTLQKIGQAIYQQPPGAEGGGAPDAGAEGEEAGAGAGKGGDEDIKDADFEVK